MLWNWMRMGVIVFGLLFGAPLEAIATDGGGSDLVFPEAEKNQIMLDAAEPFTQQDLDRFVAVVEAYETWVRADADRLNEFSKLSPPKKQMRLRQILGKDAGTLEHLMRYVTKVSFVTGTTKPGFREDIQKQLRTVEEHQKALEAVPAEQRTAQQKAQMKQVNLAMTVLRKAAVYPQESIDLYLKNKALIDATITRLEQADRLK